MDKSQYYRMLGIREDATKEQVRRAYEIRMSRLKSSDYEDEPEYAMRKIKELQHAYSVISGTAPPAGAAVKKQKPHSFKEIDRTQKPHAKTISSLADSAAQARRSSHNKPDMSDKKQLGMMGIVLSVLLAVFPLIINSCQNDYQDYDYTYDYEDAVDSMELTEEEQLERLDWILEHKDIYDYMDNLSDEADEDISVEAAPTEKESSHYNFSMAVYDLLNSMGVDYNGQNVDRLLDEENYMMDHSDYQTAKAVCKAIGAPSYKNVAGKESLYRNEAITDYEMYLEFICDVLQEQTPADVE